MAKHVPYFSTSSVLITPTGAVSPVKNVLLIGQKNTSLETGVAGAFVPPKPGYSNYDYYKPIKLPSYGSGIQAVSDLSNYGIKCVIGQSFTYQFAGKVPDVIINLGSQVILQFNQIPYGFEALTEINLSGTVIQTQGSTNVSSSARRATIVTLPGTQQQVAQLTLVSPDSGTYNTTDTLVLNGINNNNYPDPNLSDPIACMVFDFFETSLSATPSADGSLPTCYISIVSDRDPSISPNSATPISLSTPSAVEQESDGSVNLVYNITPGYVKLEQTNGVIELESSTGDILLEGGAVSNIANFGYLPQSNLSNTSITQVIDPNTKATGTYNGYTYTGDQIVINVIDFTGTFVSTQPVTVTLDPAANVGEFIDGINFDTIVMQHSIKESSDFTNYSDFFSLLKTLNGPDQGLLNHVGTIGVCGNTITRPNQSTNLPIYGNGTDNTQVLVTYPYFPKFGDVLYEVTNPASLTQDISGGRIAACLAYLITNGDLPFYGLTGVSINHLPVSSDSLSNAYSQKYNGTGDYAIAQGWLPLIPNSTGTGVSLLQSNTTLVYDKPGVVDSEFGYISVIKRANWVNLQVLNIFNSLRILPNNAGIAYATPQFLTNFKTAIGGALLYGQNLGAFMNVSSWIPSIVVKTDPTNPTNILINIPLQMTPQVNSGVATNYIYSATVTPPSA
jgi:hypothetical protein